MSVPREFPETQNRPNSPSKERRFFILGYYGFGNWGDELTLLSVLRDMQRIERKVQVPFVYSVLIRDKTVDYPLPADVQLVSRKQIISVFSALKSGDCVLIGGGSLLQDSTSLRSLLYYCSLLFWAIFHKKPIVFYRSGLGPFRRKLSRWLVHIILKRTVLFIARDPETRDLALSLGCRKERTVLGIDPVCSWQENDEKEGDRGKRIAIFVREGMNEKKDLVLEGVHRLKEKTPCEVEFVAFHRQSDESVASHFAEASGAQWRYFHSPEEIWTYFSHLSAVFTMRLHPAVIASVMGVPWFAFDIDPKIISFSGLWGGTNLIHWQELSVDTFWERYTRRDEICPTLSTLAQTIQERTRESEESLENFIEAIWGSRS